MAGQFSLSQAIYEGFATSTATIIVTSLFAFTSFACAVDGVGYAAAAAATATARTD